MDISTEQPGAQPTPETHSQKVTAITEMINAQNDVKPAKETDHSDRPAADITDVRGDNDGTGAVDSGADNAPESVENAAETDAKGLVEGDGESVTLSNLAEHLGLEPADVYELEIPIADGETTTLGQLKDEFKEYGPAKKYQAKLVEEREAFERSQLQTRSELNAIIQAIPEQMRAQVINAGRAHQQQWSKDQETAVLEAIPEWQDADNRAKDRAMLVEDGAEYGFSEQEITYTQDARTLRMLRDFSRMRRELQGMKAAAKAQPGRASPPGKAVPTTQSKRKLKAALSRAKADPTIQGKAATVSALIRNQ